MAYGEFSKKLRRSCQIAQFMLKVNSARADALELV